MKLGELFIQLGVKGDTKELDKTLKQIEKAEKVNNKVAKAEKALGRELTENEKKWLKNKSAISEVKNGLNGFLKATAGISTAIAGSIIAFDRMANAMFKANQQLITFQRTSGISLNTLNRYASASSLVNYNASLQGTAQSLQNVANNLWDIQMDRGDISPFQELAYVGGKGINPFGKSLEQVIEEVRESIKTVDDLQATNIITRMGFAPEDLMMLRMGREEIERMRNLFATPEEQEAINNFALQLKEMHLQLALIGQRIQLKIMPYFIGFMKVVVKLGTHLEKILKTTKLLNVAIALLGATIVTTIAKIIASFASLIMANPTIAGITLALTGLLLILDDIATYFLGGESVFGKALEFIAEKISSILEPLNGILDKLYNINGQTFKVYIEEQIKRGNMVGAVAGAGTEVITANPLLNFMDIGSNLIKLLTPIFGNSLPFGNANINNNTTIYTTQPADKAMGDNINNMQSGRVQQQMQPQGK